MSNGGVLGALYIPIAGIEGNFVIVQKFLHGQVSADYGGIRRSPGSKEL